MNRFEPNVHLIEVKYLGPTETRGARFKMTSLRFGDSVTESYDYKYNSTIDMAREWLVKRITRKGIVGSGETPNSYIIAINVFERLKNINKGGL